MTSHLSARLADAARAGVFQLNCEARLIGRAAEAAQLACFLADIGHARDKAEFLKCVAETLCFPHWFGGNWDALADGLKDLSWLDRGAGAESHAGYVLVLEKSWNFGAACRHEFGEAMDVLGEVADYWRGLGKPFWTLIGGTEGWSSGWPPLEAE